MLNIVPDDSAVARPAGPTPLGTPPASKAEFDALPEAEKMRWATVWSIKGSKPPAWLTGAAPTASTSPTPASTPTIGGLRITPDPPRPGTEGHKPIDPLGALPKSPTAMPPPQAIGSLSELPMSQQMNVKFLAGDQRRLSDYLTKQGYAIAGRNAGGLTFKDKKGKLYHTKDFAVVPAAVGALPAAGQTAGAIGGTMLGSEMGPAGTLGLETAGAAGGELAGEQAQRAILQHYGVPVAPQTVLGAAKGPALAGGLQLAAGGLVPAVASSVSGLGAATEAEAGRAAEIAKATEAAAQKQAESLLAGGLNVGKLSEQLSAKEASVAAQEAAKTQEAATKAAQEAGEKRFGLAEQLQANKQEVEALHEQARQSALQQVAAPQEQAELHAVLGTTPEEMAGRRQALITEEQPWPAEPYFTALDTIQKRQGALFEDALKNVKGQTVPVDLGATVDSIESREHMVGISPSTTKLLRESKEMTGGGSNLDDMLHQWMGPKEYEREAPKIHQRYQEILDLNARGPEPGRARPWSPTTSMVVQTQKHGHQVIPIQSLEVKAGASVENLLAKRTQWGNIIRSRSAKPVEKSAAHEMIEAIDDALGKVQGMTPEDQVALQKARVQYARYKGVFTPELTGKVAGARDPVEAANLLFGARGRAASPKIALNMIDALKDDPAWMEALRQTYADKILSSIEDARAKIRAGKPGDIMGDARLTLAIHDQNGVLKALYGDGAYGRLKDWLDTSTYEQFAQRALANPVVQQESQRLYNEALNTPAGKKLLEQQARLRELYRQFPPPEEAGQQVVRDRAMPWGEPAAIRAGTAQERQALQTAQAQLAQRPSPESVGRVAGAYETGTRSPQQAALEALPGATPGRRGFFSQGGMTGYMRRRLMYSVANGRVSAPIAILAGIQAGAEMARDSLFSMVVSNPETGAAYLRLLKSFAQPGRMRNAGRIAVDLMSGLAAAEIDRMEGKGVPLEEKAPP